MCRHALSSQSDQPSICLVGYQHGARPGPVRPCRAGHRRHPRDRARHHRGVPRRGRAGADLFPLGGRARPTTTSATCGTPTRSGLVAASSTPAGSTCWSTTRAARRTPWPRTHRPASTTRSSASTCSAPLLCAQAANAVMQRQEAGGVIVNISSVSAPRPSPGTAAYGAAKAGLDSLTSSLAVEWGAEGARQLHRRGPVPHRGHRRPLRRRRRCAAIERTIPLGRMARPEEVGHVAVFLASDLASYVSGARVECHGGGEPPVFLFAPGRKRMSCWRAASRSSPAPAGDRPRARARAGPHGAAVVVNDYGVSLAGRRAPASRRPTRSSRRSSRPAAGPSRTAPTWPTSSRPRRWCGRRSTRSAGSTSS